MNTSYAHLAVDIFHSNFYSIASKWQKQIINFRWYMRNGFGHRKFTRHKYQVQVIYSNIQQTWGAIERQWKKTRLSSGHQIECKKCHLCLLSALAIACSRAFTTLNKQQRSLFGWSIFFQSNNKKTDKKKYRNESMHSLAAVGALSPHSCVTSDACLMDTMAWHSGEYSCSRCCLPAITGATDATAATAVDATTHFVHCTKAH